MMNSVLARTSLLLDIQIAAVLWLCHKEKCVRLLRPWRGGKHFSTSKTVFINMSFGVDLSVRTLEDQIWAYARFINEAPGLLIRQALCSLRKDNRR